MDEFKIENGVLIKYNPRGNATSVIIPEGVTSIGEHAFNGCSGLTSITIPMGVTSIGNSAFRDCSGLTSITIPEGVTKMGEFAFRGCSGLISINIPKGVRSIGAGLFAYCSSLTSITISDGLTIIERSAFSGCSGVTSINIPKSVTEIENWALRGFKMNFIYIMKDGSRLCTNEILSESDEIESIQDLRNINKTMTDIGYKFTNVVTGKTNVEKLQKYAEALMAKKISMPLEFIETNFDTPEKFSEFMHNAELKWFKNINKLIPKDITEEDHNDFVVFANNIGCFSNNLKLNQKANEWLLERLQEKLDQTADLPFDKMHSNFASWKLKPENEEFSNFLFAKHAEKKTTNFEEIKKAPAMGQFLGRIFSEFSNPAKDLCDGGRLRDSTGKLMFAVFVTSTNAEGEDNSKKKDMAPTVELFKEYFSKIKFSGIETAEDEMIAKELSKWNGMEQEHFDRAKEIMGEFNRGKLPTNLVGEHLQDLSNEIKYYCTKTKELLARGVDLGQEMVGKLASIIEKKFTYDWLEKNDPQNFCLGLYCDCCANLAGVGYGIMRSNFVHPDVQNLVIKNKNGNPVAKSTLYVNRREGYGVFNNVEVSDNMTIEEKDEMFKVYLAGIEAFATTYNKENPNKPLKKISVGMNRNDLSVQLLKGNEPSEMLRGINFGDYGTGKRDYDGDWNRGSQYIVWQAPTEKSME